MKTDLYTKIILTIIAVALTINLLKDFNIIPTAQASEFKSAETTGSVKQTNEVTDVNIVQINGYSVWNRSLPVSIEK